MSIVSPNNDNSRSDISIGKFCFSPVGIFAVSLKPSTKKEKRNHGKWAGKELKGFKEYSCTLFLVILK